MVKLFLHKNWINLLIIALVGILVFISYKVSKGEIIGSVECSCTDNSTGKEEYANTYFFEVMGQVNNPGVYEMDKKILVIEAIDLAGGFSEKADLAFVHKFLSLAGNVQSAQKIYIPALEESYTLNNLYSGGDMVINSGLIKINLNTADQKTLMTISGVGEATATKIMNIRPIKSLEDLKKIVGIPQKTLSNIIEKAQL